MIKTTDFFPTLHSIWGFIAKSIVTKNNQILEHNINLVPMGRFFVNSITLSECISGEINVLKSQ